MKITTIGLDLAKSVFQVHGIADDGTVVVVKRLLRKQMIKFFSTLPSCLVGMEACATAHHWARALAALGHEVKLMPPAYVKAYVKRGKNDAADAEAICEAVRRPTMRFVPVKTPEQQSILMVHRTRALIVRQRTMAANALRAHLAEFGLVCNPGVVNLIKLTRAVFDEHDPQTLLPEMAKVAMSTLVRRLLELEDELRKLDKVLHEWHRQNEASRRLAAVPGRKLLASVGQAPYSVSIRIVDDEGKECPLETPGEVLTWTDTHMAGYWNNEKATRDAIRGNWYHTGDVGYLDSSGYLYLVDRKKDMIVSGGENIYCREVEMAIGAHPRVAEVAVVGIPDKVSGESVLAVVVAEGDVSGDEIIEHCRSLIASYKKPRRVEFVDRLPRTATGKIDKVALRAAYQSA